jgi:hypothetical protein
MQHAVHRDSEADISCCLVMNKSETVSPLSTPAGRARWKED